MKNNRLLYFGLLLCVVFSFELLEDFGAESIIGTDSDGYYMYLPGTFIYKGFKDIPLRTPEYFHKSPKTGQWNSKYTYGVALMELPFFLLAHLLALLLPGVSADGYSFPYRVAIQFGALLYAFLGVRIINELLKEQYLWKIRWGVLMALFFGTNLMHYTIVEPGMSHVYSFFLCALLFFLYHRKKSMTWIGLCSLLLVLIRPTNVFLALLFLALYPKRIRDVFTSKPILLTGLFAGLLFGLQLFYWKFMSGEWTFYSYNKEPTFIHYASPKMLKVLFDVQNGWFVYSPILIFPFIGMIQRIKSGYRKDLILIFFFLVMTYIFGSWWAWWFGGAFGHRCYVDFYPLLAFPFAYFLDKLSQNKRLFNLVMVFMVLFVFYSIRMTVKYSPPWDGADWNWSVWLYVLEKAMLFK